MAKPEFVLTPAQKTKLYDRITKVAEAHRDKAGLPDLPLDDKWADLVVQEPKKLFHDDGSVRFDMLERYRREKIFVSDVYPLTDQSDVSIAGAFKSLLRGPKAWADFVREILSGRNRGWRADLKSSWHKLDFDGAIDLMRKYPANKTPGTPWTFDYNGCNYNLRWIRHIYFNNLINKTIGPEIDSRDRFVNMDIGCSYSIFSYMLKSEHPNTTCVIVDFPDQLILAHYFLGGLFPEGKFASILEFPEDGKLTREFVEGYDFVLVPVGLYHMLQPGAVDMVSNFVSFGEMRREWFMDYIESDVFKAAEFLFTSNRFESSPRMDPTYDSDLTILDYPLHDYEKIHFGIYPHSQLHYLRKNIFMTDYRSNSSQYFDFIGRRNKSA